MFIFAMSSPDDSFEDPIDESSFYSDETSFVSRDETALPKDTPTADPEMVDKSPPGDTPPDESSAGDAARTVTDSASYNLPADYRRYARDIRRRVPNVNPPRVETFKETLLLDVSKILARYSEYVNAPRRNSATPVYPEYRRLHTRLRTFDDWPIRCPVRPHELAVTGFFYADCVHGLYDCVKCFQCGQGLCMFEEGDDVLQEHLRFNHRCYFIRELLK